MITDLELQKSYPVVIKGKKIFTYRSDFNYNRNGEAVAEDCKGSMNSKYHDPVFKLKKKLIEAIYGIDILIVT